MAANKYVVTFDPTINVSTRNGVQSAVVVAESAADAKAILKALHGDEVVNGWDNATVTAMAAGANMVGWKLRTQIIDTDGTVTADVTVTGAGGDDTVDEIAALSVIALNALSNIASAAYNSGTQVLTVAGTGDGLGDQELNVFFYAPGSTIPVPGFVGAIVDGGASGDALTVTLAADAYTVPKVTAKFADKSQA